MGVRDVPTDRPEQRTTEAKKGSRDSYPPSLTDRASAQCSVLLLKEGQVPGATCGVSPPNQVLHRTESLSQFKHLLHVPTEHGLALNPTITSSNPREFLTLLTGRALGKWGTREKKAGPHLMAKAETPADGPLPDLSPKARPLESR